MKFDQSMKFDHPMLLVFSLVPVIWAVWEWRGSGRHLALLLKAGAFAAITLALAGPRLEIYQSKVALALLADTSASITVRDLAKESDLANQVERARGRHWMRVIPFARGTRGAMREEHLKNKWELRQTAGPAGHGTDLESAIRDGVAASRAGLG